jgi:CheY-like chemotaxis protein
MFRSALVVDDEPLIRMDAADIIAEIGYSIVEARTADEALEILEEQHEIDLVFTDIQMPGRLDGLELAKMIEQRWPEICVVVASGAARPSIDQLPGGARLVVKPFAPDAIRSAVADACEQ